MPDREKIINEYENYVNSYISLTTSHDYEFEMHKAVLAMLKEQQADIKALKRAYNDLAEKGQPVVRCKDCKHRPKEPNLETYESGFDLEFPEGSKCPCRCCGDEWYSWYPDDEWFCAEGERKEGR